MGLEVLVVMPTSAFTDPRHAMLVWLVYNTLPVLLAISHIRVLCNADLAILFSAQLTLWTLSHVAAHKAAQLAFAE